MSCEGPISNEEDHLTLEEINLIDYELVYNQHSALAPGTDSPNAEYDAIIYCRTIGDTMIQDIPVYKYRFIKIRTDTAETTMNFMHITDTSIINYAHLGNEPFIFLKSKKVLYDSIKLEETPYSTILFPYKDSVYWYTRPESTELYSTKLYTEKGKIEVDAGKFDCAKVYTQILPGLGTFDLWAEQWWNGTVLIKSYLNYGENTVIDEHGKEIGEANSFETFELKEYRKINE